jgi:hypothetical protein
VKIVQKDKWDLLLRHSAFDHAVLYKSKHIQCYYSLQLRWPINIDRCSKYVTTQTVPHSNGSYRCDHHILTWNSEHTKLERQCASENNINLTSHFRKYDVQIEIWKVYFSTRTCAPFSVTFNKPLTERKPTKSILYKNPPSKFGSYSAGRALMETNYLWFI